MSFNPAVSSAAQLWEATLAQLMLRVTRQNYDTWLRNTVGLRYEQTTLVVAAANDLACDWLSTRMRTVVAQALTTVAGPGMQVRFEPAEAVISAGGQSPLQPALLPNAATPLNPRFTFLTFLEAGFNRLALTAAQDVAASESSAYSPLFITGGTGSGKTHLLHAIAHEAAALGARLLLAGAEQFLSEYTTAVRTKTGAAFRARYRDLDLLLIDDVDLLLGKKATLNELYQTLAGLHDQGRRVAVTGDLSAISGDAARFKDQLGWGLVASIEPPSVEDRVRFVHNKAEALGAYLPKEVEDYLALRIRSNIRDLEGAVNRVTAIARISRETITIDFAARALQPVATTPASQPAAAPSEVLDAVCKHLCVESQAILSQKRDRDLTYARHLTMYLLRQDIGLTYAAIAHLLGKKDHSTVVHACAQVNKELDMSPAPRADIDAIRASLTHHGTAA
ncbi:MAG: chromosomal replication initiator protein DnaA [Dehalococcoidia bacterium]|nr:chromosomal replication initiator protein DnaA [Dehalococcoidia bacterium]